MSLAQRRTSDNFILARDSPGVGRYSIKEDSINTGMSKSFTNNSTFGAKFKPENAGRNTPGP